MNLYIKAKFKFAAVFSICIEIRKILKSALYFWSFQANLLYVFTYVFAETNLVLNEIPIQFTGIFELNVLQL